jgi:hypothetical protein
MILGTDGRCNDPALAATGCPACGAVGRFAPHSSYRRHLEDLEGGELVCEAYGICPRSLHRLMACLPALLVALASPADRAQAGHRLGRASGL